MSACPHSQREVSETPILFRWALRPQCPVSRRKIVVCWARTSLQTGSRCAWYPLFSCFQSPLNREWRSVVVFLSCPLVKKHADLFGSFLYSQSTMKDMYSKPTNRTELSVPMNKKALRSHALSVYIYKPKMLPGRETTRTFLNS